ncbi:MAG: Acyl-CoA reductase (LuxC) superfamily protein [uncultured bacterium]|nr:MAG: Acyl-CoA reductase (LuxC) superfamily protein [uncultured bacterium]
MNQLSQIKTLLGASDEENLTSILDRLASLPPWRPFDERAINFVAKLSQRILTTHSVRDFPELAALGHWFRKARLLDMARIHHSPASGQVQIGRGLAFHLAPSNVDSVFMYSWLLSLLAGNTNLVRVSQKGGPQQDFLVNILHELSDIPEYSDVTNRFVLMTYPHNDSITEKISKTCMVRVIWGGDATVRAIRAIPLRPMAMEICFADRFSASALSAEAVIGAQDTDFNELIKGFYNDTYWFAQQACSSPRMIAWIGSDQDIAIAKNKFWSALTDEVTARSAENSPAMVMARLDAGFEYAAAGLARLSNQSNLNNFPARLELTTQEFNKVKEIHCGNGLFLEMQLKTLTELGPKLTDKEQTLTVFGFKEHDYLSLISTLQARALDRIVPVGTALTFDPVWDGQELITSFTRLISWPHMAPKMVSAKN